MNNGAAASAPSFAGSTLGELLDLLARTAPGVRLDALDALGASLGRAGHAVPLPNVCILPVCS